MRVGGVTSQLDLPSLTPLFVAIVVDCNYWSCYFSNATSEALLQVVDN